MEVGQVLVCVRGRVQQLHDQHLVQGVSGGERRGQGRRRCWGTHCGRTRSESESMNSLNLRLKISLELTLFIDIGILFLALFQNFKCLALIKC